MRFGSNCKYFSLQSATWFNLELDQIYHNWTNVYTSCFNSFFFGRSSVASVCKQFITSAVFHQLIGCKVNRRMVKQPKFESKTIECLYLNKVLQFSLVKFICQDVLLHMEFHFIVITNLIQLLFISKSLLIAFKLKQSIFNNSTY